MYHLPYYRWHLSSQKNLIETCWRGKKYSFLIKNFESRLLNTLIKFVKIDYGTRNYSSQRSKTMECS